VQTKSATLPGCSNGELLIFNTTGWYCGTVIPVSNGIATCVSSVCSISGCLPGTGNCDGSYANGCEALLNTTQNCGACGNACTGLQTCSANVCTGGTKLAIVQQPSNTVSSTAMTPAVTVQVQSPDGSPFSAAGVNITLSLVNPAGAALSGSVTQATNASGLAAFSNLTIDKAGTYTLSSSAAGLTSATSNFFTVSSGEIVISKAPTFVSVGTLAVGTGTVNVPLPPSWQPGDLFVLMGFCPQGAPFPPITWKQAATYQYTKIAQAGDTGVSVVSSRGPFAGIVAAFRGVKSNWRPGIDTSPISAYTEEGSPGLQDAPYQYYFSFPAGSGSNPSHSLTCPAGNCLIVGTFQSEGTNSWPTGATENSVPYYTNLGNVTEYGYGSGSYAITAGVPEDTYFFNLGFVGHDMPSSGASGGLNWGRKGYGGKGSGTHSIYYRPVAWFSQIMLWPDTTSQ